MVRLFKQIHSCLPISSLARVHVFLRLSNQAAVYVCHITHNSICPVYVCLYTGISGKAVPVRARGNASKTETYYRGLRS